MISAVADRIHYAEGRRTNFTVVAGALLAGGVAVLTFVLDKNLSNALNNFALSASIGSIALGLLLLIVYERQTNRYPWTSATDTWKWFYRDALPDQQKFDWTWRDVFMRRLSTQTQSSLTKAKNVCISRKLPWGFQDRGPLASGDAAGTRVRPGACTLLAATA